MAGYNVDSPGSWNLLYDPATYPLNTKWEYATDAWSAFRTVYLDYLGTEGQLDWTHATEGIHWHIGSGESGGAYSGYPFAVRFILETAEASGAGTTIGYLYEARLRIPFVVNLGTGYKLSVFKRGGVVPISQMAVEEAGRLYGNWINTGGRPNPGGYGPLAHAIQSPPYIIESLLRDTAGAATANIDTASFDDCEATRPSGLTHQVILAGEGKVGEAGDDRPTMKKVIAKVCQQSPYAFYYGSAGKARMLNLTPYRMNNPNVTEIPKHDIDVSSISIGRTKLRDIINYGTIDACLRANDEKYTFSIVGEDTTSQTTYPPIREDGIRAPYINDETGLAWMSDYWFSQPSGSTLGYFLSRPKVFVKFRTPGIKWAHLEIGDWITLDDSLDTAIKLMGQSWNGIAFLVIEKTQAKQGVEYTAIRPLQDASKGL